LPDWTPDSFDVYDNPNAKNMVIDVNGKKEIFTVSVYIVNSIGARGTVPEKNIFWIGILADQVDDGAFRDRSLHGRADVPMLYSAQDVYMEDINGKRIKVDPDVYFNKQFEHLAVIHQKMVDLNVYPGSFYLRLNLNAAPPSPQSRWTLHLGKITIGGISVDIPDKPIVFRKGEVSWRVPNFLP
jgi:hypothetical protein